MRGKSHARCGAGENLESISKSYLSLLFAEAVVYDTFLKLMKLSGNEGNADEYIKEISVAVAVEDTTKITVK